MGVLYLEYLDENTQELDLNKVLFAYNDNVMKFQVSDDQVSVASVEPVIAEVNGVALNLYAGNNFVFYLNLKELLRLLVNNNRYADDLFPNINAAPYCVPEPSIFKSFDLVLTADFNGTLNTTTLTGQTIKAVTQVEDYEREIIDFVSDGFRFLLKNKTINRTHEATFYKGYPFDICLVSNSDDVISINNRSTNSQMDINVKVGGNRLFVSDGDNDWVLNNALTLQEGLNELHFDKGSNSEDVQVVTLKVLPASCGAYFKFYRPGGGWSYLRMIEDEEREVSVDDDGFVKLDFDGIGVSKHTVASFGKNSSIKRTYYTELLDDYEAVNFKDLLMSPRVELYLGSVYDADAADQWMTVLVNTGSAKYKQFKKNRVRFKFEVFTNQFNLK